MADAPEDYDAKISAAQCMTMGSQDQHAYTESVENSMIHHRGIAKSITNLEPCPSKAYSIHHLIFGALGVAFAAAVMVEAAFGAAAFGAAAIGAGVWAAGAAGIVKFGDGATGAGAAAGVLLAAAGALMDEAAVGVAADPELELSAAALPPMSLLRGQPLAHVFPVCDGFRGPGTHSRSAGRSGLPPNSWESSFPAAPSKAPGLLLGGCAALAWDMVPSRPRIDASASTPFEADVGELAGASCGCGKGDPSAAVARRKATMARGSILAVGWSVTGGINE